MKKHKRGRTQRGGYLFYPGPGDDVHAFEGAYTNLKDRVSSFVPSFPNLNPLSYFRTGPPIAAAPVAVDYAPAPAAAAAADKPLVGNLEYQSNGDFKADSPMNVEAEAGDAGAEAGAEAGDAGDGAGDAGDGAGDAGAGAGDAGAEAGAEAGDADDARDKQAGGRRRRRRRTTKKRKRSNKRKRTMKRRRSMRRRR